MFEPREIASLVFLESWETNDKDTFSYNGDDTLRENGQAVES